MPLQFARYPWESAYPELWPDFGWCPSTNPYNITDLYDVGGQNSHGTLTNFTLSTAWATPLTFDGVNDYVNVPHSPGLNLTLPFSISMWIKTTTASNVVVFEKNGNSGFSVQVVATTALVSCWTGSGGNGVQTAAAVNNGNWRHLLISLVASGGSMWLDGVPSTQVMGSGCQTPSYGSSTPLYMGSRGGSFGIAGSLDDIQLRASNIPTQGLATLLYQLGPGGIYTPRDDSVWNVQAAGYRAWWRNRQQQIIGGGLGV